MLKAVCDNVSIPVIASGGAGKLSDFPEVFEKTGATAGKSRQSLNAIISP